MEYYAPFKKRCRALHYILHSGIKYRFLGKKKKKKEQVGEKYV